MNQKELLLIAVTVFVTIIVWVISELYLIHKSTPTDEEIQSFSVNYSIDTKVMDTLQKKTP